MGIADSAEAYLRSVEASLVSIPASASDLANRIWSDIARYGPQLPQSVSLPGIGSFELQPPPPPPPPPPSHWVDGYLDWIGEHKVVVASAGLGAAAVAGYGVYRVRRARLLARKARVAAAGARRRKVVVVLGADSALGRQLVSDLEGAGYIVIASVESPAAVEELERRSHGYCRVLVLDPGQPEQVPHFLRSLQATLSLRFPTSVSGDPYQGSARTDSQHTSPYIYAVVSLLTLTSTSPAPLEVHKPAAYAQHMQHAHITPVTVVQSLIGALRSVVGGSATRSIVFAIPSQSLSLHSAFTGPEVAAAAATHAAANVLRTELPATRVIVARIGELTAEVEDVIPPQWTAPQRTLYGTQFERHTQRARQRFPYPTSLKHASKSLVDAIAPPRFVFDIIRVPRIARRELYIGARSAAYAVAGSLPELFRDLIIALPDILARLLNVIRPIGPALPQPLPREWQTNRLGGSPRGQTSRRMIESAPGVLQMPEPQTAAPEAAVADQAAAPAGATHHDSDEEASETSSFSGTVSDADLDFESGEDSIATGRTASTGEWVSLRDRRSTNATVTPGFA